MTQSARFIVTVLLVVAVNALAQEHPDPLPARPVQIDKQKVFTGIRIYTVVNAGADAGTITVNSRYTETGEYLIHDQSSSKFLGIDEQILMLLDGESFAPHRVLVQGQFGPTFIDINWDWKGETVNGKAESFNFQSGAHAHHDIERQIPPGTLTRGAALFLVNAMDLKVGSTIELNWFNSQNGQIKPISLNVEGIEQVTVPAGTFDVFRIEQTGGQPGNTIYVSTGEQRRIVRFDVTGTDMQIQLVSAEPTEPKRSETE